ncbi:fibronectin type III domain-containing protein [Pleionea sediminis]|uniref:fibronectin type III domain-containing protein n=1 Tax=Pleionea sediminis TaxID=2569479 RepID=UPI0011849295|nr:fibronectin type III domain-containing protein [Pleionea sediminis]
MKIKLLTCSIVFFLSASVIADEDKSKVIEQNAIQKQNQAASPPDFPCPIAAKTNSMRIPTPTDDCDDGGGGPTGPYRAPSTPTSIQYDAFTYGDNKITWGRSNGYNYSVSYRLEEQRNNGSWQQIYSGSRTYFTVNNKSNGNYKYRVRGCNTKGCSSFRTGLQMKVSQVTEPNYSSLYPGLESSRQGDSVFKAANPGFVDVSRRNQAGSQFKSGSAARTSNTQPFNLGIGFLLTEGRYAPEDICMKTNNLYVQEQPLLNDTLDYYQIETSEDLYKKLDMDISADMSMSIGAFSAQAEGTYELFRETEMSQDFSRVLVKWQRRGKKLTLRSSSPRSLKNYYVNNYINPNNSSTVTETHFRNLCGDKYVSSVVTGARAFLLLEISNKNIKTTEMEDISYEAQIKFSSVIEANSSGNISRETREFFEQNQIRIKVLTEGGNSQSSNIRNLSLDRVRDYLDDFIDSVDESGYVALDKELSYYPVPLQYNNLNHFQVFRDYRPIKKQLSRWIALDSQVHGRCVALEDVDAQIRSSKYKYRCNSAAINLGQQVKRCAFGQEWPSCQNPVNTNVVNYAYNNIPDLYSVASPEQNTSTIPYFYVDNCGAFCGGNSGTRTAKVCLTNNECLVDTGEQYTQINGNVLYNHGNRAPAGAHVNVARSNSPRDGSASQTIAPDPDKTRCLRTTVTVKSKGWWGGGAWYEGSQTIHGRCPTQENYYLPQ